VVDFETTKRRTRGDSVQFLRRMLNIADSLAERGEFELPVEICEQSDDSSNSLPSTIQSVSFRMSRRIVRNSRVCAGFPSCSRPSLGYGAVKIAPATD
jgi:hypothetical protein